MSNSIATEKVIKVISECVLHQKRIEYALSKLKQFMPLDTKSYKNLNDEQIEALDQFLFRFSKLQDAIGQRLFSGVLEILEEPVKETSFLDRLNRLEQLNVIESKEQWLSLRNMRNKLAHEYEDDLQGMSEVLNLVYASYDVLAAIFVRVKNYIDDTLQKNTTDAGGCRG